MKSIQPTTKGESPFDTVKNKSKLFTLPESDPLLEREKFAISLRKEKKKIILDLKRKKTYDQMAKRNCAMPWNILHSRNTMNNA